MFFKLNIRTTTNRTKTLTGVTIVGIIIFIVFGLQIGNNDKDSKNYNISDTVNYSNNLRPMNAIVHLINDDPSYDYNSIPLYEYNIDESIKYDLMPKYAIDYVLHEYMVKWLREDSYLPRILNRGTPIRINIYRQDLINVSCKLITVIPAPFWRSVKYRVNFIGEVGIDTDGLTREWLEEVTKQLFDPASELFETISTETRSYKPIYKEKVDDNLLLKYKFVGRLMAETIILGYNFDIPLATYIYGYILGYTFSVEDVNKLDPVLYNALVSPQDDSVLSEMQFSDIKKDYKNVRLTYDQNQVTQDNYNEYIEALVNAKYIDSVKQQLDAIKNEFLATIPMHLLYRFSAAEFRLMVCGQDILVLDDIKRKTHVDADTPEKVRVIEWFWQILADMSPVDQTRFVKYWTGMSRPNFNGSSSDRGMFLSIDLLPKNLRPLPLAHTCSYALELPIYENYGEMKEDLEMCCVSDTGFNVA